MQYKMFQMVVDSAAPVFDRERFLIALMSLGRSVQAVPMTWECIGPSSRWRIDGRIRHARSLQSVDAILARLRAALQASPGCVLLSIVSLEIEHVEPRKPGRPRKDPDAPFTPRDPVPRFPVTAARATRKAPRAEYEMRLAFSPWLGHHGRLWSEMNCRLFDDGLAHAPPQVIAQYCRLLGSPKIGADGLARQTALVRFRGAARWLRSAADLARRCETGPEFYGNDGTGRIVLARNLHIPKELWAKEPAVLRVEEITPWTGPPLHDPSWRALL